jgi:hypothetical protein
MFKLLCLSFLTHTLSINYPAGDYEKLKATINENLLCVENQCIPFFENSFIMIDKILFDIGYEKEIIYDKNVKIHYPKGTYAQSCSNFKSYNANYLCAKCLYYNKLKESYFIDSCIKFNPYQHIFNENGNLKIDHSKSPIFIINNNLTFPKGDYVKACVEIEINKYVISAMCKINGGYYVQKIIAYDEELKFKKYKNLCFYNDELQYC